MTAKEQRICKYCGGDIAIRNPTGKCDHLHYPELVNKTLIKQDAKERLVEILCLASSKESIEQLADAILKEFVRREDVNLTKRDNGYPEDVLREENA